jgi:hypothetical protein
VIEIPLPVVLLPWLLAILAWVAFPWLARRVERPDLLRWLPPGLVIVGGALVWLAASEAEAGGHDARAMSFEAASAALCDARQALPDDRSAAVRAFRDRAHESLHVLASDPVLDRSLAAALLRAKEDVESGIARDADGGELAAPMATLVMAAERALTDLGIEAEPCAD